MIATIENEFELIKALKAENNQEYDKLHFFRWASRPVYMDSSKQKSSLSRV